MSTRTTDENYFKVFFYSIQKRRGEGKGEKKRTRMAIAKVFLLHANTKIKQKVANPKLKTKKVANSL